MRRLAMLVTLMCAANVSLACDLEIALDRAEKLMQKVQPKVKGSAIYRATMHLPDGRVVKLGYGEDYSFREVPIVVLDNCTCEVELLRPWREINKKEISEPLGVKGLRLESRSFGPIWNGSNTQFEFSDPNKAVILEAWKPYHKPEVAIYSPYSKRLHGFYPEFVTAGRQHYKADLEEAIEYLRYVKLIPIELLERFRRLIPLLFQVENMDPDEFYFADKAERDLLADKPYFTLGVNGDRAFRFRVSNVGARGMMQIFSCAALHEGEYAKANFKKRCTEAPGLSHSHPASIAAGILVVRMKDKELFPKFAEAIFEPNWGDQVSAASYNDGTLRPAKAIKHYGEDWRILRTHVVLRKEGKKKIKVEEELPDSLRAETAQYLLKLEHVVQLERSREAFSGRMTGAR